MRMLMSVWCQAKTELAVIIMEEDDAKRDIATAVQLFEQAASQNVGSTCHSQVHGFDLTEAKKLKSYRFM